MKHVPLQALCCECGQVRVVSKILSVAGEGQSIGEPTVDDWLDAPPGDPIAWNRCCVIRKCSRCKRQTMHAYIREDNQHKDTLEWDHRVLCQGWAEPTEFGRRWPRQCCYFCQGGLKAWIEDNPGAAQFVRMQRAAFRD